MSLLSQMFPPKPTFTEQNVPDLSGKVFLITGSTTGIGYQLAQILYGRNATVYICGRTEDKVQKAIKSIQQSKESKHSAQANGKSEAKGRLEPLTLDLADLVSVKRAAQDFLSREERLHVLVHNAGVMTPPKGSKSVQGHDLEFGTNTLGPFLLNHLLEGILKRTAAAVSAQSINTKNRSNNNTSDKKAFCSSSGTASESTPNSAPVRVVWLSSFVTMGNITNGGIRFDPKTGDPEIISDEDPMRHYMQSKVGNVYLAHETAKRLGGDGILSLSVNPGALSSDLQRHISSLQRSIMKLIFKPPIYGAYTELYAALSPDLTLENDNGAFIIPWGRKSTLPAHILNEMDKAVSTGAVQESGMSGKGPKNGKQEGLSKKFWDWCERETKQYW